MPGYEVTRIVEATQNELTEMTCMICQDVFCNPMVTSCCGQTFCESCIKSWIDSNHTCPYDYKVLKVENLITPPKVVLNLLNKLKIKCAFASKGCTELTTIENIENHQKYCIFDKELCKTCGFVSTADHECLKSLLDYKQNMSSIMDKLRKELEESTAQNRNLRSQIENYMRTIQDLTKDRSNNSAQNQQNPNNSNSNQQKSKLVNTNRDMLIEARKFSGSPIVDGHKTRKDIVEKVVEIVKEAITIKGERIYDVARFIKEYMDSNFMGDWNCYFIHNNIGFVFHNIINDCFIEIKFGKILLTVYKTFDSLGFSRLINFIKAGVIKDFLVTKTGFDDPATNEIEKVTLNCLKTCPDMNQFTDRVTNELMTNYGGIWHCFIYKANFGFYCIRSDKGKFVLLSSADIKILIFQ